MIRLENKTAGHNKFYEIYFSGGRAVHVRYGAIDTPGTIIKKSFTTYTSAAALVDMQTNDKLADGYRPVDDGHDTDYWRDRYNEAHKKISSIRSAVL